MASHILLIPALMLALWAMPAMAVDPNDSETEDSESGDEEALDAARIQIEAEDFAAAIATLQTIVAEGPVNADALNLLGFASRKSGELEAAEQYYQAALTADPDHLGALEYQGELFIMTGRIDAARANLERLTALCGTCEEQVDLAEALAEVDA